jgi:hypothetical protein
MAAHELQLLSRVIRTGNLQKVIDWGITEKDFLTNEGRTIFLNLVGYYSMPESAGSVIGENAIRERYPTFVLCDDQGMTDDALCLEVRKHRLAMDMDNLMDRARTLNVSDPAAAIGLINSGSMDLLNIGFGKSQDMSLGRAIPKLRRKYQQLQAGVNFAKAPWPWEPFDEETGGIQPDDYIVIYGRPKSYKSWILAYLIAFIIELGLRAVIYTKEMSADNIYNRVYACLARVMYRGLRLGSLSQADQQALYAIERFVESGGLGENVQCLSGKDTPRGGDTVPWLRSKVDKYKPDIVFVDGMYLMSDVHGAKKDHERVRNISRDLSDLRLSTQTPIIATLQATREAAKHQDANLDEISFSDAIGQDATAAIRVMKEYNKETGKYTALLKLGGAREWDLHGFRINVNPARDFSFHSEATASELASAERKDVAQSEVKTNAQPKGPSTPTMGSSYRALRGEITQAVKKC